MANLPVAPKPGSPKVVVLIVEDELLTRMDVASTIEDAGFEITEAGNADEAVLILEARPDVRIVFTDIDMPGSMDGLKLAAAVRGRWPPIEIIVTSGLHRPAPEQMPERCTFIPKPYRPRDVVEQIRLLVA